MICLQASGPLCPQPLNWPMQKVSRHKNLISLFILRILSRINIHTHICLPIYIKKLFRRNYRDGLSKFCFYRFILNMGLMTSVLESNGFYDFNGCICSHYSLCLNPKYKLDRLLYPGQFVHITLFTFILNFYSH